MGYRAKKEFSNEEDKMTKKHLRKCSSSLIIREIQIKTTLRFLLTPVRMAKIKNTDDSRCWQGCRERWTLLHCWWGCKLVQLPWKSVWRFLRKMNIILPEDPAIPLLGIYPRDTPTYMHQSVHCSSIYNSQKLERTQMSFSRWMNTKIVVHLHNGVLLRY